MCPECMVRKKKFLRPISKMGQNKEIKFFFACVFLMFERGGLRCMEQYHIIAEKGTRVNC